jgi:hypothetical protein
MGQKASGNQLPCGDGYPDSVIQGVCERKPVSNLASGEQPAAESVQE